jgi:hypothetical protein
VRIQSSHHHADRGLDVYFSPPEAALSLLHIEGQYLPKRIWEPAAGDGAIVRPFLSAGFTVIASDLIDYGLEDCQAGLDYLKAEPVREPHGIVTNPPYKLAFLIIAHGPASNAACLIGWTQTARDHRRP